MAQCDPNELLAEAACFNCLTPYQLSLVQAQLLCDISAAGAGAGFSAMPSFPENFAVPMQSVAVPVQAVPVSRVAVPVALPAKPSVFTSMFSRKKRAKTL